MLNITTTDSRDKNAATVTVNQFKALGQYANYCLEDEEMFRHYISSLKKRDVNKIDLSKVKSLLVNSWNTEKLIRYTSENFNNHSDGFVTQWIFPQAYYSVFNSTLAFFKVVGHDEDAHVKVRKKLADMASKGKYPSKLCVWGDGAKDGMKVHGLDCDKSNFQPLSLSYDDINDIQCHIHSFIKTTREMFLSEKRDDKNIKKSFTKKDGTPKKKLTLSEWQTISDKLEKTSWLCLLYRKRIKANYHDIDTFLSIDFELSTLLISIVDLVNILNLVNEINIYNSIGDRLSEWSGDRFDFANERIDKISDLFKSN
jgi:hypothetical protein